MYNIIPDIEPPFKGVRVWYFICFFSGRHRPDKPERGIKQKDSKEHIPAVVTLMRMVKTTPLIHDLEQCKSEEEICQTILKCEFQVL